MPAGHCPVVVAVLCMLLVFSMGVACQLAVLGHVTVAKHFYTTCSQTDGCSAWVACCSCQQSSEVRLCCGTAKTVFWSYSMCNLGCEHF